MRKSALVAMLLSAAPAAAQMPEYEVQATPQACAATYELRLQDARQGIEARDRYIAERTKLLPMFEWFREHCRYLTPLEIAIRKLDDENAFVCDTKKGRPKELTPEIVGEYADPASGIAFVEHYRTNSLCEALDVAAGRPSLVTFGAEPSDPLEKRQRASLRDIDILCWKVESEKCTKLRAAVAKFKARAPQR